MKKYSVDANYLDDHQCDNNLLNANSSCLSCFNETNAIILKNKKINETNAINIKKTKNNHLMEEDLEERVWKKIEWH
ncbi:hypothetical protein ACJX0J_031267, partial [Zea mays]